MTENWAENNLYCPICGNEQIRNFENNRPVADFYCVKCSSEFELKSKENQRNLPKKIVNGAYDTLIQRISDVNNPDLLYLTHKNFEVQNLILIPKFFFTATIIEKRKPLADTARRAGWVGSNIAIEKVPEIGKIHLIKNQQIIDKQTVLSTYQKAKPLDTDNLDSRGWLLDTLFFVEKQSAEFSLKQMYEFEEDLAKLHPNNFNVKAKIRQQLQLLRDKGFIHFDGNGHYTKI
ncbi:type II restriction endonuclease DpnI [Lactococcus hodotermopsidis]|uniref:Type II restriction endonuclease DpnI n=2 Tax=Pseudolactococcus hodotermopsidis TaxID=2709157 RepID=A0A6A0BF56_9LACT|nr:type II restriction endonuclease DpnI [Lactococcus hodotermopsidis]